MTSNFTSEALLCNSKIFIQGIHGEIYTMTLPVLKDKVENLDFEIFLGFCGSEMDKINKENNFNLKSKLDLFKLYKAYDEKEMVSVLEKYFKKYMIGFYTVNDELYWGNRIISRDVFNLFCDYCAIAMGVKSIGDLKYVITNDMDAITKRQIMLERKIAATKRKDEVHQAINFDIIMAGVCHEYGYTFSDLYNMTLYSIYFLYSQFGKIMSYEITNIACGNGLLKKNTKHKHWAG